MPATNAPTRSCRFTTEPSAGANTEVCSSSHRLLASSACVVAICDSATATWARAAATCARVAATDASSPLTRLSSLDCTCCSTARAEASCAVISFTLVSACSRSKRFPAPAAASSRFCATRRSARVSCGVSAADRGPCRVELFAELPPARHRVDQPSFGLADAGALDDQSGLVGHQPRFERAHLVLVGRRIDAEQHGAFFTGRLFSTGTSMTRPRTCATTGTTYLMTRTSPVAGATTLSSSTSVMSAMTGNIATPTFHGVVQGSSFSLMKMSQTRKQ